MQYERHCFRVSQIIVLLLSTESNVQGDWIDTFDGGFDQTWNFIGVDSATSLSPSETYNESTAGNILTPTLPTNAGGPEFHFGYVDETFTDVRVSATASGVGTGHDVNVLARGNPATLSAYAFGVDDIASPGAPAGLVAIARVQNLAYQVIATGVIPDYETVTDYFLEFTVIGNQLSGTVYSDATRSTELVSIGVMDSTLTSGVSGVSVSSNHLGDTPLSGTFDNVSASAIPEPSSMMFLSLGLATAFGMRRRWKVFCS